MAVFSMKAAKAQKRAAAEAGKANDLERKKMALEQAREKRNTIRAARQARGAAVNSAANQGVMDSSGALGGQSSIVSQLGYNLSFLDKQEAYADQASAALGRSRMFESRANTYQSYASLTWKAASSAASFFGGGGG